MQVKLVFPKLSLVPWNFPKKVKFSFLVLFMCLFGSLLSHNSEGCKCFTYIRYYWSLSRVCSFERHTFCDTGHSFVNMSSPKTHDTHTCYRALSSGDVTTCFNDFGSSRPGFEHPTFLMRGECFDSAAAACL